MSEILNLAVEYAPITGAMIGAAVGVVPEVLAHRHLTETRQAFATEVGDTAHPEADTQSRLQRAWRIGRASIVCAGMAVGAFNAPLWLNDAGQGQEPFVGVVVDHSGSVGSDGLQPFVDTLTEQFGDGNFDATAYVGSLSKTTTISPDAVGSVRVDGDSKLDNATKQALDGAAKKKRETTGGEARAGVVAITYGNSLGSAEDVIATAEQEKVPVFVVDVEQKDKATTEELQSIAKATGGHYWGVKARNPEDIANKVQDTLEKSGLAKDEKGNPWALRLFGVVLGTYVMTAVTRNRRRENVGLEINDLGDE